MSLYEPIDYQIKVTLERLEPKLYSSVQPCTDASWEAFWQHFTQGFSHLYQSLEPLYAKRWDFYYHLEVCALTATEFWFRTDIDTHDSNSLWFESESCVGATGYVDLFATNVNGLLDKIDYLNELGIRYLHLMPLFDIPNGDSDGGYAIKDYGKVNPTLGTLEQLQTVATKFKENNIKLVLDFVFNHTSDQHEWAIKAKQGDKRFQNFFWVFRNDQEKDQYAEQLRDIFPDKRKGCFSHSEELNADVWTTFNSFQWDLNYKNPEVFTAMCNEMLKLVDAGADVIRLDALAFTWKEPGTACENLPNAHNLIRAFNAFMSIAAPSVLLKSEAIVAPDNVVEYISPDECPLSYNPNLMALMWEALATRQAQLLIAGTKNRTELPLKTSWINYLRCHDDIGWAFADQDAWNLGINPHDHRSFLNQFYTGQFDGSFAKGVPFQYNPVDGDCRISGTLASLVGIDNGKDPRSEANIMGIRRALLLHGIMLAFKGIPLIYLGDELATPNDFSYLKNIDQAADSRWVHRTGFNDTRANNRTNLSTIEGQLFQGLRHLIQVRSAHRVFGRGNIQIGRQVNEHLYTFLRQDVNDSILVIANISEHTLALDPNAMEQIGGVKGGVDLLTEQAISPNINLSISPYQQFWISLSK